MAGYSIPKAAARLGWSRWFLWRLVKAKKVPHHVYPGTTRVYLTDDDIDEINEHARRLALG